MRAMDGEGHEEAPGAGTDYRIRDRYRGVRTVLLDHMSAAKTAECTDRGCNTIGDRVLRYDMYGFEGLHDSPGRAAPRQGRVSRMKRRGPEAHVQDGATFREGAGSGAKFRGDVGRRVYVECSGRRRRTVVFGAISDDGGRFFRTHEKFTGRMYAGFPGEMNAARGRAALIADRASRRRSGLVKRFLRENRDVRPYYLPAARPELNALEQAWNHAKRVPLVSEYYETSEDLRTAV